MTIFQRLLLISSMLLYGYISASHAGETTLVTYYPAPSGHYDSLQLSVGGDEKKLCGPSSDGTIFIDANGELQTCKGQKTTGSSSWKVSDSTTAPGSRVLMTPQTINTVYITQRTGVGTDPSKNTTSNDKLVVGGGITVQPSDEVNNDPSAVMPYSSRIVFYLNQIPQLYTGVTQTTDAVLSFIGPAENAENSFFTINNSSGNIGIGNNVPAAKLDVTGNIKTSSSLTAIDKIISGGGLFLTSGASTTGAPSVTIGSGNSLTLTGGTSSKLVNIADNLQVAGTSNLTGNVGIGLAPGATAESALQVNGIIRATTPDASSPGDAVVTKDYLAANSTACFNRFCSYDTPGTTCTPVCPAEYVDMGFVDEFTADHYTSSGTSYTTKVRSIACCR